VAGDGRVGLCRWLARGHEPEPCLTRCVVGLQRGLCPPEEQTHFGLAIEPRFALTCGRGVAGKFKRDFFVERTNIGGGLSELGGGDSSAGPWFAASDSHQGSDYRAQRIGPAEAHNTGVPGRSEAPVPSGAQTVVFIECRVERCVVTRRQRARQRGVGFVDDCDREIFEHRYVGSLQETEGRGKHLMLKVGVVGSAERSAERELAVQHARCASAFGLTANETDADGGEAGLLEHVGERTHGARAERSNRSEENDPHAIVEQLLCGGRPGVETQRREVVVGLRAHERKMIRCDRTDHTPSGEFIKPVSRIGNIQICHEADPIEVHRCMGKHEVTLTTIERNEPLTVCPRPNAVGPEARRRHDRNPGVRQWRRDHRNGRPEIERIDLVYTPPHYGIATDGNHPIEFAQTGLTKGWLPAGVSPSSRVRALS
jgi:hypothetical protein